MTIFRTQATDPAPTTSSGSSTAADPTGGLANKETFLRLLVAQIKNQDPLNPSDGTQFLSQLAQFTELVQMMNIREDVESIGAALKQTVPAAGSSTAGGDSTQETK